MDRIQKLKIKYSEPKDGTITLSVFYDDKFIEEITTDDSWFYFDTMITKLETIYSGSESCEFHFDSARRNDDNKQLNFKIFPSGVITENRCTLVLEVKKYLADDEFDDYPTFELYGETSQVLSAFYFPLLALGLDGTTKPVTFLNNWKRIKPIEFYNQYKSPVLENVIFSSKKIYSYNSETFYSNSFDVSVGIRQRVIHNIVEMRSDKRYIFFEEGVGAGTEDSLFIGDDDRPETFPQEITTSCIEDFKYWHNTFVQACDWNKNELTADFAIISWHLKGLQLARKLRELLSPDKELWYRAPVQDKSGIISEPILILPEKSEKEIELEPLAKAEVERISAEINLESDLEHERLCSRYAFADIDTIVDAEERGVFDKSDEEKVIDEYADRYDENEDQTDTPDDEEIDDYFANNPEDLKYYTFFRRYSDWPQQLDEYAHTFKDRFGVFPNVVIMNRITEGRLEDAFHEFIEPTVPEDERMALAVKLGIERGDNWDEAIENDSQEIIISPDAYFSTPEYRLLCLECTTFGSGVIELVRTHGSLADDPLYNDDCRISSRDKENTNIPVIDMVKTGKNIRNIMNLEGVKPTLIARITGHSLQAIYDWLGGKKMPNLDNLMLLSRLLNRPVEELIVTHNRGE